MILDALTVPGVPPWAPDPACWSHKSHRRLWLWHLSHTDLTSSVAQTELGFMLKPLSLPISQTDAANLM